MKNLIKTGVLLLVALMFTNCQDDESFDINRFDLVVKSDFSVDNETVFKGTSIQFTNNSKNALAQKWIFEGGDPAESTEKSPLVTYNKEGKYSVTLIVENGELNDTLIKSNYVKIFSEEGWGDFVFPTIHFTNKALNGNGALYKELVPNEKALIQKVCLDVCKELFKNSSEIDVLTDITYTIEDVDGVSAKGGQPPHISIFFSSRYLQSKKNQGLSDEALIKEIEGVLYHEITHGYQFSPKGAGQYKQGEDFFGFIEGMADYVRYVSGYFTTADRPTGGHWNDGYRTTGYFIDWMHSKDIDFVYKLNKSAKTINPWSWEAATQKILGKSVQELWNEYQRDIASGKITEIDAKLKEIRENGGVEPIDPADMIDVTNKDFVAEYDGVAESPANEGVTNLIDNNNGSKFLVFANSTSVTLSSINSSIVQKYTLTSGNDAPERDPKSWTLSGSVDGEDWTVLDTKEDQPKFEERNQTKEYTIKNSSKYKYYKFDFANHSGDIFQLSEIELYGKLFEEPVDPDALVDVTNSAFVAERDWSVQSPGGENVAKLIDNDKNSKFLVFANNTWVTLSSKNKTIVGKYTLTSGGDAPERDPKSWTLSASVDGTNWVELDSKADQPKFEERKQLKEYTIENTEAYRFYKFEFTNHEGDIFQLSEIELWGKVSEVSEILDITKQSPTFTAVKDDSGAIGASANNLFDGKPGSLVFSMTNEAEYKFETEQKYALKEYAVTASYEVFNDEPSYTAEAWVISGSDDGETWTELERKSEIKFKGSERKSFAVDNNQYFKFYKIHFTTPLMAKNRFMLGDLELYGIVKK